MHNCLSRAAAREEKLWLDDHGLSQRLHANYSPRVADKWTMLVLETLAEHGRLRFTQLGDRIGGVSQKMLTKTVRQMEADGLITRTVHPVIPPHVDYELTNLGLSLGEAFCGVWIWAEQHRNTIHASREAFQRRKHPQPA